MAQGDVTYKGKTVESLIVEFDQAKYEEFLSSGSKSPKARAYHRVFTGICPKIRSEILSDAAPVKEVVAKHVRRNARTNVSQETRVVNLSGVPPVHPLPQHQVVGGSLQPPRRNRNAERRQRRGCVNYKLEQLIVQQRQNARFRSAFLLHHIRHVKPAFGSPNVRFTRLALLKPHSPDANLKLAHLVKHKRHAPLGAGPSSPTFLKRLCSDAIISSAKAASLMKNT